MFQRQMIRAAKHTARSLGFDIVRRPRQRATVGEEFFTSAYHTALLVMLGSQESLHIVQIGANDGSINDPLYAFTTRFSDRTRLVLIEPQETLIPYLRENFTHHPQTKIHSGAIGPSGELTLHAVNPEFWDRLDVPYARGWPSYRAPTGVTSTSRAHVARWLSKHLRDPRDVDRAIVEFRVCSRSLPDVLATLGSPPEVDALQIDAEGFDDEAIYHSICDAVLPRLVYFEAGSLSQVRLRKLVEFLRARGYHVIDHGADALAILVTPSVDR